MVDLDAWKRKLLRVGSLQVAQSRLAARRLRTQGLWDDALWMWVHPNMRLRKLYPNIMLNLIISEVQNVDCKAAMDIMK